MDSMDDNLNKMPQRNVLTAFGENLFRAMAVAGLDENGETCKLTQEELAERSGVARSTIGKYSALGNGEVAANPDLATICRLAGALGVPPALLLMRPDDWSRLGQAAIYLASAINDDKFLELSKTATEPNRGGTRDNAQIGLSIAKSFGLCEEDSLPGLASGRYADEIRSRNRSARAGIAATCALPPFGQIKRSLMAPLLSLCAIIGAQIRASE